MTEVQRRSRFAEHIRHGGGKKKKSSRHTKERGEGQAAPKKGKGKPGRRNQKTTF